MRSRTPLLAAALLTSVSALALSPAAVAQTNIAVINQPGQVWLHPVTETTVGPGIQLTGSPIVGPNDESVFGEMNQIDVANKTGELWVHGTTPESVLPGHHVPGSLFGAPDARFVLRDVRNNTIYVVNTKGEVWAHQLSLAEGVSVGYRLKGPPLFGGSDDKYALLDSRFNRILVINKQGQVWAHDLSCSARPIPPSVSCTIDTVGPGYQLNGPSLFGGPDDKYVVLANDLLMVVNTEGEVWARNISHSTVGTGHKLSGPGLFGGKDDRFVVVYDMNPIPQ
jgi:hypothetical protein